MCHIRRHDRTHFYSLFFHLTASFFPPLFIYPVLSNSFMRFLLTSRNIFSLTLDLFHLVHPLAYTNTFSINGHMCKCPRLGDRTRSIVGNEEMILRFGGYWCIECDLNEIWYNCEFVYVVSFLLMVDNWYIFLR